jgi:hypothetical protein
MPGLRTEYQENILPNHLYEIRLSSPSGLGEALKPLISVTGTAPLLTLYGSQDDPGLPTLANIATKMFLIKDDVTNEVFEALPNYIAAVLKSGTVDSAVVSCISLETDVGEIV